MTVLQATHWSATMEPVTAGRCAMTKARFFAFAQNDSKFRAHSELRRNVITAGVRPARYIDMP